MPVPWNPEDSQIPPVSVGLWLCNHNHGWQASIVYILRLQLHGWSRLPLLFKCLPYGLSARQPMEKRICQPVSAKYFFPTSIKKVVRPWSKGLACSGMKQSGWHGYLEVIQCQVKGPSSCWSCSSYSLEMCSNDMPSLQCRDDFVLTILNWTCSLHVQKLQWSDLDQ